MTPIAILLFLLGLAASWVAGRHLGRGAGVVQAGAIGFCGVAAMMSSMPQVFETHLVWALAGLLLYGVVGAVLFRAAQAARKEAE